jgi:tetratricopeptide (TPR) repeat protein
MSGTAGRTNYSEWDKKTKDLLKDLEEDTEQEIKEAKEALGQNGKYAMSEAEAKERKKQKELQEKNKILKEYKERELGVVQVLTSLLPTSASSTTTETTKYVTSADMGLGKRVLNISNTTGPGQIILTNDLTNLTTNIPTNVPTKNNKLTPKSYPEDTENDVVEEKNEGTAMTSGSSTSSSSSHTIHGLIKVSLTDLHNCTISLHCKVITGVLEVSHCTNLTIKLCEGSSIVTIQADLCKGLDIQFHDAPSGKSLSNFIGGVNGAGSNTSKVQQGMYWGEDKDDRIFSAGVSDLKIGIYKQGNLEKETTFDYEKDGKAKAIGNASAEEVQFVTSVVHGKLITEKVLRNGSATGTTVAGGVGAGGTGDANIGGGSRAMTEREMKEVAKRKEAIMKALDEKLGGDIKIVDKEGNEVPKKKTENKNPSMSLSEIDCIVKDCEAQKAKGNEAFTRGEYAQAVLLYTLALDRAAELPDAASASTSTSTESQDNKKPLFASHIVLSNRSACFLKLGHHDKALADGTDAERLDPTYVKGIFRKGMALHAMGRYQEALTALSTALKIEPKNKQIKQALQFAEVRFQQELRKRQG